MRRLDIQSPSYKWWVFGTISIGTFMTVMDLGTVYVALPSIESHFHTDLPTIQWVWVAYALTISVLLLPMGRLGDMFSRKRLYITGLFLFAIGAGLAGLASNIPLLVGFKVLQGVGAAMMQGTAQATIISTFPANERGKALGSNVAVVGLGQVAGQALGGILVSAAGWRSVFFVPAVVSILAIVASLRVLDGRPPRLATGAARPQFDFLGAACSGGTLLLFLLVMSNGHRMGWGSPLIIGGIAGAVALLLAFVRWELRVPSPMLELRLFKRRPVAFGVATGWIAFLGNQSILFMMPFYLQRVLGYSPRAAGLVVVPGALCFAAVGAISGRLSDRIGWTKLNVAGQALSAAALFILAAGLGTASSLAFVIPVHMLNACGLGLFNSPNQNSILSAVERSRYGVVSSMNQLVRNTAQVTSVAITTTIVVMTMAAQGFAPSLDAVTREGGLGVSAAFVAGLHRSFVLMGSLIVLGVVLSLLKGDRVKVREPDVRAAPQSPGVDLTAASSRETPAKLDT